MNEIDKTNLTDSTKSRLNKMTEIENCIKQEIKENYAVKKLSKYVAAFDYINKFFIVLSPTSGGFCVTSSVSVVGTPVGIAGASFTLIFSLTTGIIKIFLIITRKKKKKHNKILMLD